MEYYKLLSTPPENALRKIKAGRLSGKTDINPQWRYEVMTETFGPCGIGWNYSIDKLWTEPGDEGQVFAFALVSVTYKDSKPIQGVGGSMLIVKEKNGMHCNDEAYKMAVTDALSTSLKMLGVAADIYRGLIENPNEPSGSKYDFGIGLPKEKPEEKKITPQQVKRLFAISNENDIPNEGLKSIIRGHGYEHTRDILITDYNNICNSIVDCGLLKKESQNGKK